ncbi:MAG TPA: DnaB-like helicase N-terminal domain-containing protein, partial [Thermodesulfobacteriota bacterium]|nr:DnaB-like helicase N-terminal domain-containing protein [Thermodesulfobacteriota bacterium]
MDHSISVNHKLPPQNIDAEQSVLGGVLVENEAFNKVLEYITQEDFYREAHRKIFLGMVELFNKNEPVDLITLTEVLKKRNHLEDVGGAAYLASLVDNITTASNISYYAKIVREKSVIRKLITTATEIVTSGYEDSKDVKDLLDEAEKSIFEITG